MGVYLSLSSPHKMRWLVKKSFIDVKYVSYEHVNSLWRYLASSLNDNVEVAESLTGKENGEKWRKKRKRKKGKIKKKTEAERDKETS